MANIFMVTAHLDPGGYHHKLVQETRRFAESGPHSFKSLDLYQRGFDPTPGRKDFLSVANIETFNYKIEQAYAARGGGFSKEIQESIDALTRCDILILNFPLWLGGMPAVLKGWMDKVLAYGVSHGGQKGIFEQGGMRGKRAILSLSIEGLEIAYGKGTKNGELEKVLFPIQNGGLHYVGFSVLPPFVIWGIDSLTEKEKENYLLMWVHRLKMMDKSPPIIFN